MGTISVLATVGGIAALAYIGWRAFLFAIEYSVFQSDADIQRAREERAEKAKESGVYTDFDADREKYHKGDDV